MTEIGHDPVYRGVRSCEVQAVDVVLPTYNRPDLTVEAIQSVRDQTFANWRLFVVDDASSDGTYEHVARLTAGEPRIRLVRRHENGGSAAARQSGLLQGTAPFVATIDSDDLWHPRKLERQLACWAASSGPQRDLGVVACHHEYVDLGSGRRSGVLPPPQWSRRWTPFIVYNTSTPLMSRVALEAVGGFVPPGSRRLHTTDHMDLFIRLVSDYAMTVVPDVLVRCRHHRGSRNSDAQGTTGAAREAASLLARHRERIAARPEEAWLHAWVGGRHLDAGDLHDGIRELRTGVRRADLASGARIATHYGPFVFRTLLRRRNGARRR